MKIRRNQRLRANIGIILLMCALLPLAVKLFQLDLMAVGTDTRTHVYKASVLMRQMKELPVTAWGSWDWSWHLGYEFLDAYSPFPYYAISSLSMLGISIEISLKVIVLIVSIIASVGAYLLARRLTQDPLLGVAGAILFIYSPLFVTTIIDWGNLGKFVAYAFAPWALLFVEKGFSEVALEHRQIGYTLLSSLMISLGILSNVAVGIWIIAICVIWVALKVFLKAINLRRGIKLAIMLLSFVALNCLFFLLPLLHARVMVLPVLTPGGFLSVKFLVETFVRTNLAAWLLTGILLLYVVIRHIKLDILTKCAGALLMTYLLYNIISLATFDVAPFLSVVSGDRSSVMPLVSFTILIPLLLKSINTRAKKIMIIFFIIGIPGLISPPYYPVQYPRYREIADFISNDPKWSRYAFLPREPIGAVLPSYSGKPYVDGWSFLSDPDIFSLLGTPTSGFEKIENLIVQNCSLALKMVEYLGVKYLIVESADPIYGYDFSFAIFDAINSSNLVTSYRNIGTTYLFYMREFKPIHFYEEYPKDLDEALYTALPNVGEQTIIDIKQSEAEFYLELNVARSVDVVIPVVNSDKLLTYVNDTLIDTASAPGNLVAIHLPGSGRYKISIRLDSYRTLKVVSLGISTCALTAMVILLPILFFRKTRLNLIGRRRDES